MDDSANPYRSPVSAQPMAYEVQPRGAVIPAARGWRFLNMLIDYAAILGFAVLLGMTAGLVGGQAALEAIESIPEDFIGLGLVLSYFIFCEGLWRRTLGKLITGTKVVNEQGGKPTFGQIVGRSFARLIPFEAFSFFGTPCRGWHDRLPKTYVVKANRFQALPHPEPEMAMGRIS